VRLRSAGLVRGTPMTFRGQNVSTWRCWQLPSACSSIWFLCQVRCAIFPYGRVSPLVFGLLLVLPIGSADMPVVMSVADSYSGLASAAHGFVLKKQRADYWPARSTASPDSFFRFSCAKAMIVR